MKILRLLFSATVAMLAGAAIGSFLGVNPLIVTAALVALSFAVPRPGGALTVSLLDLARPSGDNPGAGGGIDSEIILINAEDVNLSSFPTPTAGTNLISSNIPMKSGKYMHRFYATDGTIKPNMKKIKGSNKDSGGYEVSVEGFHPGMGDAIMNWIANFGYSFKGFVIVSNHSGTDRYLLGERGNLVSVDDLEMMWGEEVDKDRGTKVIFKAKQSRPIAKYTGAIVYDPGSASW